MMSWDSLRKEPKMNVGPKALHKADKIEAFFFGLVLAKSTLPDAFLNEALAVVGRTLKQI